MFRARVYFFILVMIGGGSAFAANALLQEFESSLFGVSEISHFGLDEQRFNKLSTEQRENILLAKDVLLGLFKAIQNKNGKPQQYLSDELNKKFPTKLEFVQSLVADETSILALIIGDFTISKDGKNIVFHFSVISSAEGMVAVTEKVATVRNSGAGWRVAKI